MLSRNSENYEWTSHAKYKMQHYRLSENRIKKVIRKPERVETGIAPKTIAVMQPTKTKRYQEIWVMYKKLRVKSPACTKASAGEKELRGGGKERIRIISAWIYPGKSPAKSPIPQEILDEVNEEIED